MKHIVRIVIAGIILTGTFTSKAIGGPTDSQTVLSQWILEGPKGGGF